MLADLQDVISKCEAYIAAKAPPPAVVAQTPQFKGGQSPNCSDISGTSDKSEDRLDCQPRTGEVKTAAKPEEPKKPRTLEEEQRLIIEGIGSLPPVVVPPPATSEAPRTQEAAVPPTNYMRPTIAIGVDLEIQKLMEQYGIENPTDCGNSLDKTKTAINAAILDLENREPEWVHSPYVDVGTCTSRLQKLYGPLVEFRLRFHSIAQQVANREARACLHLKREYLENACKCIRKGVTFSTDLALQDQTLETFAAVKRLEQRAREDAIQNSLIADIVGRAAEIRDCYNIQTLETLRSTERALKNVVGE